MKKGKSFAEKAYKTTRLDYGYTQTKIQEMLGEIGINNVRITKLENEYKVEFIVKLFRDQAPRKVMINIPLDEVEKESSKKRSKRVDALFRVLYYHLKNRFVAIQNGLREFDEEFASDIVVIVNGKEQRLGDIIVPEIKRQLKASEKVVLKLTN